MVLLTLAFREPVFDLYGFTTHNHFASQTSDATEAITRVTRRVTPSRLGFPRSAYLSPQKSREEKVTSLIPTLPVRRGAKRDESRGGPWLSGHGFETVVAINID